MDNNLSTILTFLLAMIIIALTIVLNRLKKESPHVTKTANFFMFI